ncbi:helix-turn-helix transcriptional regulator [Kribbella sp. NPDC023855]|uniref:helix-turn-helix transcriptional regulator n=1 Tax=Kribbella sp. NPDC023855 TaxID=3154698 RepID=UPI0033EA181A
MGETEDDRFGRELRRLREQAGLTQVQLATRLGYSHTYVSKLESGARVPRITFAGGADELLDAGGSLIALATNARARRHKDSDKGFADGSVRVPPPRPSVAFRAVRPQPARIFRLPTFGITCPLHGMDGCTASTPADGLDGLIGEEVRTAGTETVHGLAALLVSFIEADVEGRGGDLLGPVEQTLGAITGLLPKAPEPITVALLRLAAQYADLAAWLRVKRAQQGIGMAWLHRSVEWASAARDHATACVALSSMSALALLEGDGATAVGYAQAAGSVDNGRRWIGVQARLDEMRGHAQLGDWREVARLSTEAQRGADRLGDLDRIEAPWLFDAEGATFIASHLAGALRDLTERTGDAAIACRAVTFAESALTTMPARMPLSRVLLTLRLADSHACGGAIDAAVAVARPVLADAEAAGSTLIDRELDRLRTRLATRGRDLYADR